MKEKWKCCHLFVVYLTSWHIFGDQEISLKDNKTSSSDCCLFIQTQSFSFYQWSKCCYIPIQQAQNLTYLFCDLLSVKIFKYVNKIDPLYVSISHEKRHMSKV